MQILIQFIAFGHLLRNAVVSSWFCWFPKIECTKFDPNQSDDSWEIWALHENGTHLSYSLYMYIYIYIKLEKTPDYLHFDYTQYIHAEVVDMCVCCAVNSAGNVCLLGCLYVRHAGASAHCFYYKALKRIITDFFLKGLLCSQAGRNAFFNC